MRTLRTVVILAVFGAGLPAAPAGGEPVELDRRYIDPLNGFSLRPPAGLERTRETGSARLVSWQKRDPDRGAVLWTFSVLRAAGASNRQIDLKHFAEALADKLRVEESYRVESSELSTLAGKPAIYLRGTTGGVGKFWQKQVWVQVRPPQVASASRPAATMEPGEAAGDRAGQFLVVVMTGPADMKDSLEALSNRVLETLEVTDPQAVQEERKRRLDRGQELLASLTPEILAAAAPREPQWFLLRLGERDAGFMYMAAARARREGVDGVEVRSCVLLAAPKTERRVLRRAMFAPADRSVERWGELLEVGEGPTATRVQEEGLKQEELIVCTVSQSGRTETRQQKIPPGIYLPRATGVLLPRLVDRNKPQAYAFAVYGSEANSFDMRSFVVVGPETVTIDGRRVSAVRATDQPAADTEATSLWLDKDGGILRMVSPDGLVIEPVSRERVVRAFPEAEKVVRDLGR